MNPLAHGTRVRQKYDARIHESPEQAHATQGTIVEHMRIGFRVRVQWDDGRKRGIYDGWMNPSSIEPVP